MVSVYLFCILIGSLAFVSVFAQPTPGVYFTQLGTAGSYQLVTDMLPGVYPTCTLADSGCVQTTFSVPATPLAPFDEEVSLHLRGPQNLTKIYIYQKVGNVFNLTSYWVQGGPSHNISFLSLSGNWSICGGNALGYCESDGTGSTDTPQVLNGWLADSLEIIVNSAVPCEGVLDCGYYRGVGLHSWAGDKIFVVETSMPYATGAGSDDVPAIWSLNAKIARTAQYGCNCNREGCGEFDICEITVHGSDQASFTLYSYNGDAGCQGYFPRPVNGQSVYFTHYSESDNRIYNLNIPEGCFSFGTVLTEDYVNSLQAIAVDQGSFPQNPNTNANFTNCNASIVTPTSSTSTIGHFTTTGTTGTNPITNTGAGKTNFEIICSILCFLFVTAALM